MSRLTFGAASQDSCIDRKTAPAYAESMEVRLEPELAAKVEQWSVETGRPVGDLVEDAITGYFSEVQQLRETLDRRYDEMASGQVKGIPGDEARRMLEERIAARQRSIA
ncbi:MAG TPA: hypothetical protein VN776_06440 [Terracidiphilus sp.]|nr:hypothetical protein [Terracidiphilus sp.]